LPLAPGSTSIGFGKNVFHGSKEEFARFITPSVIRRRSSKDAAAADLGNGTFVNPIMAGDLPIHPYSRMATTTT
jgi:hypothetical protein